MLNRVVLVGRMTRDPELRRTANGTPVASFTLAINRNFSSQSDERQADFIPCVVWNKAAESTARYCQKGSLVGVDGRLQSRTYENQDGRKVNVIEAICESVQFINTWSSQNQGTVAQNGMNVNKYSNNGKGAPQSENWNYNNTATNDASIDDLAILDDDIQF